MQKGLRTLGLTTPRLAKNLALNSLALSAGVFGSALMIVCGSLLYVESAGAESAYKESVRCLGTEYGAILIAQAEMEGEETESPIEDTTDLSNPYRQGSSSTSKKRHSRHNKQNAPAKATEPTDEQPKEPQPAKNKTGSDSLTPNPNPNPNPNQIGESSDGTPGANADTGPAATPGRAGSNDPLLGASTSALGNEEGEKVENIVGKALDAMGGAPSLKRLERNATVAGRLIPANQDEAKAYTYHKFRKGKKWRVDLEAPTQNQPAKRILAYNGLAGWQSSGSVAEDLNPVRLTQLNDDNERGPSLLARFGHPNYTFKSLGPTAFREIPVFAVEVRHKEDRPTIIFIDKRNYQVVGIRYDTTDAGDQGMRETSVEYSEYRPTDGTMYPFRQTKYIDGKMASEIAVSSISMSDAIDEAVFDRPQSADKVHLSRAIVVPFEYQQKEILIKGRINNGEEVTFLFDTGASDTIIDRRVAAEHYLLKQGQAGMMALSGQVNVNDTVLKRLEIGNLILNDVDARITSLLGQSTQLGKRIAGIIGTNVMRKAVVRIDYGKPSLTFYDKDEFERPKDATIAPLVQQNVPVVKARLNGGDEVLMLADTGAAFNNLPYDIARRQLLKSGTQETHTTEGAGLDGKRIKLGNVVVRSVTVGAHPVSNMNFTYAIPTDTKTQARKGDSKTVESKEGFFQNSSVGILGNPFWENFIVTIDYKFQRLLLEPNPSVRVRGEIGKWLDAGDQRVFIYSNYREAESAYQKALMIATNAKDVRNEAILWGRVANMRRLMAKDLARPEHARQAYDFFVKAQDLSHKAQGRDVEGRILADWSLLYLDNGQLDEARQTITQAVMMAPQDPQVNVDYAIHLSKDSNFLEMQKYLDKALFLEPSNWQALWAQFKLADKFMDYHKGVATLKEIVRYYPWSKLAANKLNEYRNLLNASKQPANKLIPKPTVTPDTTPIR